MIKGKLKNELTMQSILTKVNELEIYRHFFGEFTLNQVTCNKMRGEKSPSFIIGNKYGNIQHYDFSNDYWRGDCFSFVKQLYHLPNLDSVLRKIDSDMGLGISGEEHQEYKRVKLESSKVEINKRNTLIQVITRKFVNQETSWWNSYYQDIQDLRDNNIYSIKKLYLNKQLFPIGDDELRFGYFYPEGGYCKIYFPNREKKKKWVGNVPLQTSWGTENLRKDKNSLICKSLKDYLVCKKILPYVCGIQNESLSAFSEEFIKKVKENSNIVFYGGDSDAPGKQASYVITNELGYKHINPPDSLLDCCKDFADMGRYKGLKTVEDHFKIKGLII